MSERLLEQLRILRQTDALALHQLCLEPQTQRLLRRYGISDGSDANLTNSMNLTKLSDGIDASVGSGGTEATRASNGVVLGGAYGVVLGDAGRAAVGTLVEDHDEVEAPPTSRATKRIHRLHDELDELDEALAYP